MFRVIFGSSMALFLKRLTARNEVKFGTQGSCDTYIISIWDIFELLVFKVILGSFSPLVSKLPSAPKTAGLAAKLIYIWN